MTSPPGDTTTDLHAVIAALRAERDAAVAREAKRDSDYAERAAHQGATVEVLQAMVVSPGDPKPVFEVIVRRARDLCDGYGVSLAQVVDSSIVLQAYIVADEALGKRHEADFPRPVATDTIFGRAILAREPVQIPDVAVDETFALRESTLRGAVRALVAVPLMRDGEAIGAIDIARRQAGEFSPAQIELLRVLANQAVIAINSAEMYRALQERTAALATRNSEYGERIEHQAATIDVLKAMSASPGDPQPVFDLIVERARDLCDAYGVTVLEFDGGLLHYRAANGVSDDAETREAFAAMYPRPPTRDMPQGRAILDRRTIRIDDLEADQGLNPFYRGITAKSTVVVPLMRGEVAIGTVGIGGRERGGFSGSQIELLQTFAEQAVIAITSAETYRALQTRTSDLQQSLEYQTATSDVLKVISRSAFDLQPVLDTLVETAARLCEADQAVIVRREGETVWLGANCGFPPEYEAAAKALGVFPLDRNAPLVAHRALIEGRIVHVHDVAAVPGYPDIPIRLGKQRTSLAVPLSGESVPIGAILLARQRVEPFTDRQIELVSTFADQAVIAIENTRLITEQREALEQQTATAEVLQVINGSPGDLEPVFETLLDRAMRLCGANFGEFQVFDGERLRLAAFNGVPDALAEFRRNSATIPTPGPTTLRMRDGANVIHTADLMAEDAYREGNPHRRALVDLGGARTVLAVALRKDDKLLGAINIYRQEVKPFSDRQVALLQSFATQAIIAMENARLLTETREALEQQTATAEVLQVINSSPGDLAPVFDAMLEKAMRLCEAACGGLFTYDGERFQTVAARGVPAAMAEFREQNPPTVQLGGHVKRLLETQRPVQILDWTEEETYRSGDLDARALVDLGGARTNIVVPLLKDEGVIGFFGLYRQEVQAFTDKQISLLENFAAQAVIAMENARLITETREALEQQTATAEVLQVLNTSPGNLAPVFDVMLQNALSLCGAAFGQLVTYDGTAFRAAAWRGYEPGPNATAPLPGMAFYQLAHGEQIVHIPDITADDVYRSGNPVRRLLADKYGGRTAIWIALRKDEELLGAFVIYRTEVRPFSNKQIALLQNFAAQAVIAIENARLLNEIRQRQEELRITFENMGDGVAMFDETLRLVAWNRKFQEILDVTDEVITSRLTYADYIRYLAERGEYGPGTDPEAQLRHFQGRTREHYMFERIRPDGRVIEVRHNPVPGGGFVLIYADVTERKRNEAEIRAARDAAEEASRTIEAAYRDLKAAQANLIQAEKMASLGQLTAGIAHEIKNPLNFVNNFSALSTELIDELRDVLAPEPLGETARTEVDDLTALLKGNLEKVVQHGQRADGIVRSMLDHSRGSSGERRMVDLNALADEALNLAYHGARAQDQSFNVTLERDFDEGTAPIEVNPQDITRVFLNIFSNGFYATTRRARDGGDAGFEPTLKVTIRDAGEAVEIRVRDNGIGIPVDIRDKLFQPFFTTKPTGEGTGLGLSITYDIVTQQHGGSIAVDSKLGEYSEFTIQLPRNP